MKRTNRILSLMLVLLLVVGIMPMTVSAMQVFVYISIEDSTITLNVESADSIENVKQKIQDKEGISPDTINLFFNGTLLNDGRTLGDYNIKNEDTIQVKLKHSHCICGSNTDIGDHTTHSDIEFTPWDKTDSMPTTTGNYVLMNDVTITSQWKPANGTVLCLNGHTLSASVVDVVYNYKFTLCDCGDGKITTGESTSAEVVFLYADSRSICMEAKFPVKTTDEGCVSQMRGLICMVGTSQIMPLKRTGLVFTCIMLPR